MSPDSRKQTFWVLSPSSPSGLSGWSAYKIPNPPSPQLSLLKVKFRKKIFAKLRPVKAKPHFTVAQRAGPSGLTPLSEVLGVRRGFGSPPDAEFKVLRGMPAGYRGRRQTLRRAGESPPQAAGSSSGEGTGRQRAQLLRAGCCAGSAVSAFRTKRFFHLRPHLGLPRIWQP